MAKVSVIVRTKNERRWLRHCVLGVLDQISSHDVEILICDTGSDDGTPQIAQALAQDPKVTFVSHVPEGGYIPGKVLNFCVGQSPGSDYYIFLSAHCVPMDVHWLDCLVAPLEASPGCAGVYGRQLPMLTSTPENSRDLLLTFGAESREQKSDCFFHNANSCVRGELIRDHPFSGVHRHLEDRAWGQEMIDAGHSLVYEAEAAVLHHHGLHQHREDYSSFRSGGVNKVLHSIEPALETKLDAVGRKLVSQSSVLVLAQIHHKELDTAILDCIEALAVSYKMGLLAIYHGQDASVLQSLDNLLREVMPSGYSRTVSRDELGSSDLLSTEISTGDFLKNLLSAEEEARDTSFDAVVYLDDLRAADVKRSLLAPAVAQCLSFEADILCPVKKISGDTVLVERTEEGASFRLANTENFLGFRQEKKELYELYFGAGAVMASDAVLARLRNCTLKGIPLD